MPEVRTCPTCNVALERKAEGYAMGSILSNNRVHADIYECPKCNEVFLFDSDTDKMVKCPVCGNMHHADEKCLFCALNEVAEANSAG